MRCPEYTLKQKEEIGIGSLMYYEEIARYAFVLSHGIWHTSERRTHTCKCDKPIFELTFALLDLPFIFYFLFFIFYCFRKHSHLGTIYASV
jgi:hypothetical protein